MFFSGFSRGFLREDFKVLTWKAAQTILNIPVRLPRFFRGRTLPFFVGCAFSTKILGALHLYLPPEIHCKRQPALPARQEPHNTRLAAKRVCSIKISKNNQRCDPEKNGAGTPKYSYLPCYYPFMVNF